jgi:geranylgeranyl diphosphate synthase type I
LEKAERIARYKSGKYTVERPLHLGALLAAPDRGEELYAALSAFGLPLGDAFQMRDDVIGAFGDSALTGKPVGDDLREGKATSLVARATANATAEQRAVLDRVGEPDLDDGDVNAIQATIVATGALDELERRISELAEQAVTELARCPLTDEARRELAALAEYVVARRF